ncbi:hypothetical protein GCM10023185_16110 [Hymenobacter saemangeumensis]|uniref:Outer membrane protein beta-barrel domain-containing protein n=1 Tax=Hymenobacter saemangeumensis TaxID=1084522 RepID=A0ABP8I9T6_9BACT
MRRFPISLLLLPAGLAFAHTAQAQVQISVGPQVGAVSSFSSYYGYGNYSSSGRAYQTRYLAGFEAGFASVLSFGHFQLQPTVLFAQRGFRVDDNYSSATYNAVTSERLRLNYLCTSLLAAYSLQASGQGWQVFAGPYLGLLLGGNYTFRNTYAGYRRQTYVVEGKVPVAGSEQYRATSNDPAATDPSLGHSLDSYSSRSQDVGLQVGVGYSFGKALVRASYSHGLNNLGVGSRIENGSSAGVYTTEPPKYSTQAVVVSFAYLLPLSNRP